MQDFTDRGKHLHDLYMQAVAQFKNKHIEQGISILKCILNNNLIQKQEMMTLRYSSVISLGEFYANKPDSQKEALNCFQIGLTLLMKDVNNNMLRQNKAEEEFNLMIKMIQIAEQLKMTDRHIELLEKAVSKSPLKWKKNLLQRLKQLYQKNENFDKLLQLEHDFDDDVYYESRRTQKQGLIDLEQSQKKQEEETEYIPKIKIRINLCQNQSELKCFSVWQKLLTMVYIMLKSQKKRGLKRKTWLEKYKDQEEWRYFVKCMDLRKTQIEIVFYEQQLASLLNQLNNSLDSSIRYGDMIREISEQMLTDRYKNIKQEMHKYEYMPRYKNLEEYYHELCLNQKFKPEWLRHLQFIDKEMFQTYFGLICGQPKISKRSTRKNVKRQYHFDQKIIGANSQELNEGKGIGEYHKKLNSSMKNILRLGSSLFQQQDNILFSNIQSMVQRITCQLISQVISASIISDCILNNFNIRFILGKAVLQLILIDQNCLQEYCKKVQLSQTSLQSGDIFVFLKKKTLLLELLNLKLEQLINKHPKDETFSGHQTNKITILSNFISKTLVNQTEIEYQQQLNSLSEEEMKQLTAIFQQKLKYHCLIGQDLTAIQETAEKCIKLQARLLNQREDIFSEQNIQENVNNKISQWKKRSKNKRMREEEQLKLKQYYSDSFKKLPEMVDIRRHLKYLNSNADQKSIKDGSFNAVKYIQTVITLFELFFNKIQACENQITATQLQLWSQLLKIKETVQDVYQKFTNCQQMKGGDLDSVAYTKMLANLIKLYLLKKDGEGDSTIRIIFFLTNILIKGWSFAEKEMYIPRALFVYYRFIQYKPFTAKALTIIRKRLYINIIVKNVESIYNSPIFNDEKGENCPQSCSIKQYVIKMMDDIYTSIDFQPKKMEDCLGLYIFIAKSKGKELQPGKSAFNQAYSRAMRASYRIYEQKREDLMKYCPQFSQWMTAFDSYLLGEQNKSYQQLLKILKQQHKICNCCDLPNNNLYVQSLYILGKYFQAKPYTVDENDPLFDRKWQFNMLDQQFYLEYLFLNLNSGQAWKNLIRVNTFKVHIYYDSMVGNPLEDLRSKIDYTKRLISLAQDCYPHDTNLMRHCSYYSESIDLLKIRDRQYKMTMKDLEGAGQSSARETKESIKRYKQGLKKMLSIVTEKYNPDVRIRYMRVLELKLKLAWVNLQKEYKEDEKKDAVIIELEEYQNPQQKVFKPFKVKEQIMQIISDTKGIVNDLQMDSYPEQVLHLEQDLIMEIYIFLYRNMQYKFQKIINRLCEVIRVSSKTDQCRKLKQMQHTFNELEAISHLFENGEFISSRSMYKVNSQKMVVNKTDLEVYTVMFQNIFAPEKEQEKPKTTESLEQFLANRKHPKGRKTNGKAAEKYNERDRPIQLENDNTSKMSVKISNFSETASVVSNRSRKFEQQPMDFEFDRRSRRSSLRERITANFNPDVHIEVGKYFYQRLKQYMLQNESAASRFNSIHSVVGSYSFRLLLLQLTKIMQQLYRILINLTKAKNIKTTNRRILILTQLTISQLVLRYGNNWQKANDMIKQYYDLNSDDLVTINYERREQEQYRVEPITDFYHRSIVTQIIKMKFIQHLFRLLVKQGEKDKLLFLINKLLRLGRGRVDRQIPKDLKIGVKLQMISNQANGIVVQEQETGESKPKDQKKQGIKFYYYLFEQGTTHLLQLFRKQTTYSELPQKYQKCFLVLKGEIEKRMAKDENNFYFNKMQEFQEEYEDKFKKQMAVKKTKREGQKQIVAKKSKREKSKIKEEKGVKNEDKSDTNIKIEEKQKKKKTRMRRRGRGRKPNRSKKLKKTKKLRKSRRYRKKRAEKEDESQSEEDMKIQQQLID